MILFYMYIMILQLDLTGSSCAPFSYNEYLQIYDSMEEAYHSPAPVSLYCVLFSLNRNIRSLVNREENYGVFSPCT